jgi:hypothetical protein
MMGKIRNKKSRMKNKIVLVKYFIVFFLSVACSHAHAQHDVPATNEFKITGDIKKDLVFHIDDIEKYGQIDLGDIPVKNRRGEVKDIMHQVKGVLVKSILDSINIQVDKPKDFGEYYFVFVASDDYKNIYSWSEIFNTEVGNKLYFITGKDGKNMSQIEDRILVYSMADINTGLRHLKGLSKIEVKRFKK